MALDIAIINKEGCPTETVSISVNDHFILIEMAKSNNLKTIGKLKEYYEDIDLSLEEVMLLLEELKLIVKHHNPIESKIEELIDLCKSASTKQIGLSVISD